MSEPVVVTALFTPVEGAHASVVHVLSRAIADVHQEEGCLLYAIHADDSRGQIVMIEKWASVALLDAHGDSAAVGRLTADLEGLLTEPPVVTRLVPLPAGTHHQGRL